MGMGEIIEELRQDRGLSQKELGKIINRSDSTISNYESDTYPPDIETLQKIADYFEVSTDYILRRCRLKYSTDLLDIVLGPDFTVGDFLNTLIEMDTESKNHLLYYVSLLKKNANSNANSRSSNHRANDKANSRSNSNHRTNDNANSRIGNKND